MQYKQKIFEILFIDKFYSFRYLIDDNRAIFMFQDGSLAWDAKDFLIEQEHCKDVSIENKVYPGKFKKEQVGPKRKEEL